MSASQETSDRVLVPLNWKAFSTIIGAVRFELKALRASHAAATDEDEQADTGNDLCYLEILLAELEDRYRLAYESHTS